MAVETAETPDGKKLPLLRFRDGDDDDYFEVPVTIVGEITALDVEAMTISRGRDLKTELYLEDFEDLLGNGDPDLMMSILLDAAEHKDVVKIVLTHDDLSYHNPKQMARASAGA